MKAKVKWVLRRNPLKWADARSLKMDFMNLILSQPELLTFVVLHLSPICSILFLNFEFFPPISGRNQNVFDDFGLATRIIKHFQFLPWNWGKSTKGAVHFSFLRGGYETSGVSIENLKVVTPLGTNFHLTLVLAQKQGVNLIEFIFRSVLATNF